MTGTSRATRHGRNYRFLAVFFAAFFFAVFLTAFFAAFFAMWNPPFRSVDCASNQRRRTLCRLARRAALLLVRVSEPAV